MEQKKILLFLVEGKNDEREINAILHHHCPALKDQYSLQFMILPEHDISTDFNVTDKNIREVLRQHVVNWRQGAGYRPPYRNIDRSDIARIFHVMDMDGAFVPAAQIRGGGTAKPVYYDEHIDVLDVNKFVGRNKKKAKIIQKLITIPQLDDIPYSVWFASCNMDHLLFNTRNPSQNDKDRRARDFAFQLKRYPDYLMRTIFAENICSADYQDSWLFISKDYHSLHRHTNLNLLLDELKNSVE